MAPPDTSNVYNVHMRKYLDACSKMAFQKVQDWEDAVKCRLETE